MVALFKGHDSILPKLFSDAEEFEGCGCVQNYIIWAPWQHDYSAWQQSYSL